MKQTLKMKMEKKVPNSPNCALLLWKSTFAFFFKWSVLLMKMGNFALEILALHEKEPLLLVKLRLLSIFVMYNCQRLQHFIPGESKQEGLCWKINTTCMKWMNHFDWTIYSFFNQHLECNRNSAINSFPVCWMKAVLLIRHFCLN